MYEKDDYLFVTLVIATEGVKDENAALFTFARNVDRSTVLERYS